jgi:hypothetical protein
MPAELTNKDWAQIRYEYEHTDRPVGDICVEHGISPGTLRDRMRRWGWTRRRAPIPYEGPPPAPALAPTLFPSPASGAGTGGGDPCPASQRGMGGGDPSLTRGGGAAAAVEIGGATAIAPAAGGDAAAAPGEPDDRPIALRLQSAVARVLPAIEANVAKLATAPTHPREMERCARALAALTRTLGQLNSLLGQHQAAGPAGGRCAHCDDIPEDIEAFREELARRIDAFVASRTGQPNGAEPQEG